VGFEPSASFRDVHHLAVLGAGVRHAVLANLVPSHSHAGHLPAAAALARPRRAASFSCPCRTRAAAELLLPSALATMDRLAATFTRLNRDLASFLFV
jgi:hypothetical protein